MSHVIPSVACCRTCITFEINYRGRSCTICSMFISSTLTNTTYKFHFLILLSLNLYNYKHKWDKVVFWFNFFSPFSHLSCPFTMGPVSVSFSSRFVSNDFIKPLATCVCYTAQTFRIFGSLWNPGALTLFFKLDHFG